MEDMKIWNNGKNVTLVETYDNDDWVEFDTLVGDEAPIHISSVYLRDYNLSFRTNIDSCVDLLRYFLDNYEIEKTGWIPYKERSGYYKNYEEVELPVRDYSNEEVVEIIHDLMDNDELDCDDVISILSSTEFKGLIVCPFFAYIHSGIAISDGDFRDPWDSGLAGYYWADIDEVKKCTGVSDDKVFETVKDMFHQYEKYIAGEYISFRVVSHEKDNNGKWRMTDDYFSCSLFDYNDDIWDYVDFNIKDEIDEIPQDLKDYVIELKKSNLDKKMIMNSLLNDF